MMGNIVYKAKEVSVSALDLSDVPDGNYKGQYAIFPVNVKVEVIVESHKITDINILQHDNGLGSAAESITKDIQKNQSLDVDAVSGATVSSKCIVKAVENAIKEKSQ